MDSDGEDAEITTPLPYVAVITWPQDPERGPDVYGSFDSQEDALAWADSCQEAASLGWSLLHGALYHIQRLSPPFDPESLMQDAASSRE
jgi:hypothetical protein